MLLFQRFPLSYKLSLFSTAPPLLRSFSSNADFPNFALILQGHTSYSHLLQILAQVFTLGAHQDSLIATRLIGKYSSQIGLRLFGQLLNPSIYPYNAIIRVLAEEGRISLSFFMFKSLKRKNLSPNDLTFSFLFKACFYSKDVFLVQQLHAHVLKMRYSTDSFVCNGLVSVYAKGYNDIISAQMVFDEIPDKSLVSCWTSLIAGYARSGQRQSEEALKLFCSMVQQNLLPENDTLVSVLSACSNLDVQEIEKWVEILSQFDNTVGCNKFTLDSVYTVLIYLYGKWGNIEKSKECFDQISRNGKKSVLAWNAIIGAYVQNSEPLEASGLFRMMVQDRNAIPNHVTMVNMLSACAQTGDLDLGSWIHEFMISKNHKGIIRSNRILATALIDMYCKCGNLHSAKEVFEDMVFKDVVSFNAMIMGLAVNGEGAEALALFHKINEFGLQPNYGSFLGVLCACSHSGFSEEGCQIFADMISRFSIHPKLEHYACYIDLLARAGLIEKALEVVASMPFKPNNSVWGALLGGCLLHSRVDLVEYVSKRLVDVDPENSAGYVMLANAFAADFHWNDVSALRWAMREKGVKKLPGCSWISVDGVVYEFLMSSLSHPQIDSIHQTLHGLIKQAKVGNPYEAVLQAEIF